MVQLSAVQQQSPTLAEWLSRHMVQASIYREYDKLMDQYRFVRDQIEPLFSGSEEQPCGRSVRVVGEREVRGVPFPVYQLCVPGLEVRFAGRWNDWVVSVSSERPVGSSHTMFRPELFDMETPVTVSSAYGISEDWVFWPYEKDKWRFALRVAGDYQLYTFLYILTTQLDVRGPLGASGGD